MVHVNEPAEAIIEMSRRDLEDIIESAAKRGAEAALAAVGLSDQTAVNDVKELRSLLSVYREVKSTALKTFVQALTMAFLAVLTLGAAIKLGVFGLGFPPKP